MVTRDRPRVTYLDFLELLLAYLPEELQYRADAGSWTKAVSKLRDDYEERFPQLFEDFVIIDRPPMDPHSDQVSHFLRVEQEGDVIHVLNPGYEWLQIPPPSKDLLKKRNEWLLKLYGDEIIREMVEEILPLVSSQQGSSSR